MEGSKDRRGARSPGASPISRWIARASAIAVLAAMGAGQAPNAAPAAAGRPARRVAAAPPGAGYRTVSFYRSPSSSLGVFTFSAAPFRNNLAATPLPARSSRPAPARTAPRPAGYDISWPQCGAAYPPPGRVAVVGINQGQAFSTNPCLAGEAAWAGRSLSLYVNLNSPHGPTTFGWGDGPAGKCRNGDLYCASYNYGYNTARDAVRTAEAAGARADRYWLDVETLNDWTANTAANAKVVAGAIAGLRSLNRIPGVYATPFQWATIAGSYRPRVPVWYPTGLSTPRPRSWCSPSSFTGAPVQLVQTVAGPFDGDAAC
jgi:hypothetical protein